jgi:hypothetical protein
MIIYEKLYGGRTTFCGIKLEFTGLNEIVNRMVTALNKNK